MFQRFFYSLQNYLTARDAHSFVVQPGECGPQPASKDLLVSLIPSIATAARVLSPKSFSKLSLVHGDLAGLTTDTAQLFSMPLRLRLPAGQALRNSKCCLSRAPKSYFWLPAAQVPRASGRCQPWVSAAPCALASSAIWDRPATRGRPCSAWRQRSQASFSIWVSVRLLQPLRPKILE